MFGLMAKVNPLIICDALLYLTSYLIKFTQVCSSQSSDLHSFLSFAVKLKKSKSNTSQPPHASTKFKRLDAESPNTKIARINDILEQCYLCSGYFTDRIMHMKMWHPNVKRKLNLDSDPIGKWILEDSTTKKNELQGNLNNSAEQWKQPLYVKSENQTGMSGMNKVGYMAGPEKCAGVKQESSVNNEEERNHNSVTLEEANPSSRKRFQNTDCPKEEEETKKSVISEVAKSETEKTAETLMCSDGEVRF